MRSDVLPAMPLWWVPESWGGFLLAALLTAVAICIEVHGKHVDRVLLGFGYPAG